MCGSVCCCLNILCSKKFFATLPARPRDLLAAEGLIPFVSVTAYRLSERVERVVDAEGFVRLRGSRYSVPPEAVGRRVVVECGEQQVVVRRGECRAHPEHVAAMWRLAFARTPVPSAQANALLFQQPVATRPLCIYEEVSR